MESIKTIKGIDDNTWNRFKGIAAKNGLKIPDMFRAMLNEYEKSTDFWNKILNSERVISEIEASALLKNNERIRNEKGYR